MKTFLLTMLATIAGVLAFSQGTETFTNISTATPSSYISRTWTGDNGLQWTATDSRADSFINGRAVTLRVGNITCNAIPNGIGGLSFKEQQIFSGTGSVIEVRVNGTLIGTVNPTTTLETATFNNLNITGNFNLEIKQTTASLRIKIDDVTWSAYTGAVCATPSAQPTSIVFGPTNNTSITGNFTAASPAADQYLVVMSTSSTLSALPQNGTAYDNGDAIGNGNVITTSNAASFTSNSLTPGTTYYFYIFSINTACSGGPLYNATSPLTGSATTSAPPACAAPTTAPGSLTLVASSNSVNGSIADATGADGYLVIRSSNSSLNFTPANGTYYTAGQTVGAANEATVIAFDAGNTFSATGLTTNTQYYFYVFAVSGFSCNGGPLYNGTSSNGSATTTSGASTGEPAGYYSTASGKSCGDLKTSLKTIVSNMTAKSYDGLWTQYTKTDVKPREVGSGSAQVIWDIYSDNPVGADPYNFTPGTNQCGNYNGEGQCYNREHSFPQNWFGGGTSAGPGTDYHHLFPTDGKVNGLRSNYIYGEVASPTTTTQNGSKLGFSAIAGFSGPVFEPINEYKGDLARAFLYMVTRYEDNMPTWGSLSGSQGLQALEPNKFPSVDIPYLKLMLKWHHQDPVSPKEINRNNGAYVYQNNRNPFVDHPEYADLVWNSNCAGLAALPVDIIFFSGKLVNDKVKLEWEAANELNFDRYEVERSFNATSFNKIGQVKAADLGNYSFSDNAEAVRGQRVYYRLKRIDKDGNFKYSEVFSLHVPQNTKFTVFPNPAKTFIQLQINKNVNGKVAIQLTDALGKVLQQQTIAVNGNVVRLSTETLSPGTYLVKFNYNGEQYIQKVIVVK